MAGLRGDDNVEQVSGGIGSSLGVFHSLAVHPPVVVVLVSPGSWYVLRSIGPFGARISRQIAVDMLLCRFFGHPLFYLNLQVTGKTQ